MNILLKKLSFIAVCTLVPLLFSHPSLALSRSGVTIDNGKLSVTQSRTWGGSVVSLKYRGQEFIDVRDAGRLMQFSAYGKGWANFTSDGYRFDVNKRIVINPNQAGDALLNASRTLRLRRVNDRKLSAYSVPREWFVRQWPGMQQNDGAEFSNARVSMDITMIPGYANQVLKVDYVFRAPRTGEWNVEIPALYLLRKYDRFYGVDAENNTRERIVNASPDRVVLRNDIGGVCATADTETETICIYGAKRNRGGSMDNNFIGLTRTFPNTAKLGAESGIFDIRQGQTQSYTSYIVLGNRPRNAQRIMRRMYVNGLR